jgi:hypothetical protein
VTPNSVEPKTVAELKELVRAVRVPLVVKGIMTPDEALKAAEAGAAGIVVSNHGGRVLDHTPGTAGVLPAIADMVKGKMVIFVDGCVHHGNDVIKYMVVGADAVLVGRHRMRAAYGGGREGVALFDADHAGRNGIGHGAGRRFHCIADQPDPPSVKFACRRRTESEANGRKRIFLSGLCGLSSQGRVTEASRASIALRIRPEGAR